MTAVAAKESPVGIPADALCFGFRDHELLVRMSGQAAEIPALAEIGAPDGQQLPHRFVGALDEHPCFSLQLPNEFTAPPDMIFEKLRPLSGALSDELFALAGRAYQLIQWEQRSRFCGRCGAPTRDKDDEHARVCPDCGLVVYPSAFPAIIVAVIRNNRILLARGRRHAKGWRSVLAGFVEPGETLEEAVRREVREEVGLEIEHIRYFGSQPWPFTNSLMIGFTAESAGGTITVDHNEILEADWYAASQLPESLPGRISIARRLIEWFAENFA